MNENAAIVGDYRALSGLMSGFLYDPAINAQQAIDLNDMVDIPEGWMIRAGYGINDRGAIVAAIVKLSALDPADPAFEIHGVLIDTREERVNGKWIPISIPDVAPAISFSRGINNNGDIVGVFEENGAAGAFLFNTGLYREAGPDAEPQILPVQLVSWFTFQSLLLNDPLANRPLQVVGTDGVVVFRYTKGAAEPEEYPSLSAYETPTLGGINGYGEFCGRLKVRKTKGSQTVLRPFRFDPETQDSPTLLGNETDHAGLVASGVNDSGDVVAYGGWNIGECLFHSSVGTFVLDNLVTGSAEEINTWRSIGWTPIYMTERVDLGSTTAPGFPVLATTALELGVVLIPVLP